MASALVPAADPLLTLVLPARNEAEIIQETVMMVAAYLDALEPRYEIIVGDSGSSDGTGDLVRAMGMERVRVVRDEQPGKGRILTRALRSARGPVTGFIDSDLEIPVVMIEPLLAAILDGAHAAIAAKTRETDRGRPLVRRLVSRTYNAMVALLLGSRLPDHQAGCKLFWTPALLPVLDEVRLGGWLWDTEVLVRLARRDARIAVFPCKPGPARPSRVRPSSILDAAGDLLDLSVRVRLEGFHARPEPLGPVDISSLRG